MNKKFTLVWGIVIAATVALITILQLLQPYKFHGALIDPAVPAAPIELPASTGDTFHLADYQGKIVLLFFGYTSCPDVCPTTLGDLKQVGELLGADAGQIQVVFVTVDPQRDTPERLAAYLSLFGEDFIGLTGTDEQLEPVYQGYGVFRAIDTTTQTATGYLVDHSSRLYLIDQQGNLRLTYAFGAFPEDIASDAAYFLKNKE